MPPPPIPERPNLVLRDVRRSDRRPGRLGRCLALTPGLAGAPTVGQNRRRSIQAGPVTLSFRTEIVLGVSAALLLSGFILFGMAAYAQTRRRTNLHDQAKIDARRRPASSLKALLGSSWLMASTDLEAPGAFLFALAVICFLLATILIAVGLPVE